MSGPTALDILFLDPVPMENISAERLEAIKISN
jgi:hypothetical protein